MWQKLVTCMLSLALLIALPTAAEKEPTFIVTVHDLGHYTNEKEGAKVVVRGYLSLTMSLYATRDQALLRDHSRIAVGDSDDGRIKRECVRSYVEIVARITYLPGPQLGLNPLVVKTLDLNGDSNLESKLCWSKTD